MNIEPIRSVGPGGGVAVPRTGLAAGEGDQLPRGGLHDAQWGQPEFRRVSSDRKLTSDACASFWPAYRRQQHHSNQCVPMPAAW